MRLIGLVIIGLVTLALYINPLIMRNFNVVENLDLWLDSLAIHDYIRTQINGKVKCVIYKVNFVLN